jgi:hypothetical protein
MVGFHVRDMADTSALLLSASEASSRAGRADPLESVGAFRLATKGWGERGGEAPTKNNEIASLATESIDSPASLRGRGVAITV